MALNITIHKTMLVQILKEIYSDASLGPILGFKGGSAALLFYDLSRFSVDLDFDLLDADKEDYVFDRVHNILMTYGTIKDAEKKQFNLFFLLSYTNKIRGAQNVKIEINRRNFGSAYHVKPYLGIPMKVMIREDMAAHKMTAMVDRIGEANRDIFDVWFFLKNLWPINTAIVEERTNMKFNDFLMKCIELLEKLDNRYILSGLGELLDEKQKAWVKSKLRTDTIFLLKARLESEK